MAGKKKSNNTSILSIISAGKSSFEFQLSRNDDPEFVDYPNAYRHMFFVTGHPAGTGDQKYDRSENAKITMAVSPHNLLSFAKQIAIVANRDEYAKEYKISTNPANSKYAQDGASSDMKNMTVTRWTPKDKEPEKDSSIIIGMSHGKDKKMSSFYTNAEALALGQELEFLAMKALEEEFKIKTKSVGYTKGTTAKTKSKNETENTSAPDDIFDEVD